jgi:hypothetical protein
MDALDERVHACLDRIAAGDLAIVAIARGEVVDPALLDEAADAMRALLAERRLTGTDWTMADVDRVRGVRSLLGSGVPSAEARALAAACRPILGTASPHRGGDTGPCSVT